MEAPDSMVAPRGGAAARQPREGPGPVWCKCGCPCVETIYPGIQCIPLL